MRLVPKTKCAGIYQIKNKINGMLYIGSSVNIGVRFKGHLRSLVKGTHQNIKLQLAYNKYGAPNFEFRVLEFCAVVDLHNREQYYLDSVIQEFKYNINMKADRVTFTSEVCAKMRRNHKGRSGISCSAEFKKIHSEFMKGNIYAVGNTNNLGKQFSQETRLKMSISAKSTWTEERRKQMSEMKKGNKSTLGKTFSQETRNKMSISAKLAWEKRQCL